MRCRNHNLCHILCRPTADRIDPIGKRIIFQPLRPPQIPRPASPLYLVDPLFQHFPYFTDTQSTKSSPKTKKLPHRTSPNESETNFRSRNGGVLWGSSRGEREVWRGRGPVFQEGPLPLQGLFLQGLSPLQGLSLSYPANALIKERNSARSEWESKLRPRSFARTVA